MTGSNTGNLLLDTLPPETLESLGAEVVTYAHGVILYKASETPEFVFFPHPGAIVSVVRSTADGTTVEAGVVGSEGAASLHSLITDPAPTRNSAVVQLAGSFSRIDIAGARAHFLSDAVFRDYALAFTSSFLNQVTQNAVCNRLHPIEQRLAKWLLVVRDRVDSDELRLTHEFLAHMLGIHRPGVTIAINALEVDRLVEHGRNRIVIRNREGLLARSCECYGVVHESLTKLRKTVTV